MRVTCYEPEVLYHHDPRHDDEQLAYMERLAKEYGHRD
jgi:hypothetical protein